MIAPYDVFVPAGGTGLDPLQTNFFQACNTVMTAHLSNSTVVTDSRRSQHPYAADWRWSSSCCSHTGCHNCRCSRSWQHAGS